MMFKKGQHEMMVNLKLPGYIWALPILPAMIFIKWEYGVALSFLFNLIIIFNHILHFCVDN